MEKPNDENKSTIDNMNNYNLLVECFEGAKFYEFTYKDYESNLNQIKNCIKNNKILLDIVLENESEYPISK